MGKHRDTFETAKTIVLALLVISLAALLVVYIGGTHIYQSMTNTDEKKVFDKLWSVQDIQRSDGLDKTRLMPSFIGYRVSGSEPVAAVGDSTAIQTLYDIVSPCVIELFGSGSTCEKLPPTDGQLLFTEGITGGEYIFLRWHEPVLYQLIYAYSAGRLTVTESDTAAYKGDGGAYVKEMVIVPESDVAAHRFTAIARDPDGNYFRFTRDPGALASDLHMSRLQDATGRVRTVPFAFETSEYLRLEPMIGSELRTADISVAPSSVPAQKTDDLLRLFGCNPDKLGSYHYDSGVVYYDSHSRIRLESGRIIYQETENGSGVGLSQLLGYSVDGGFTVFDKLAAVDCLLTGLSGVSQELVGGGAKLCLGNVYTEDGLLVFEYFYTYSGIRVGETAAKAVFGNDTLRSFELGSENIQPTGSYSLLTTPGYTVRKLAAAGSLEGFPDAGLTLRYKNGTAGWQIKNKEKPT